MFFEEPLIPRQLGRAGSPASVRSPATGSPGPPRSEPSARGSFRKRVDFWNLNRRPEGGMTLVSTRHSLPAIPIAALQGSPLGLRAESDSCQGRQANLFRLGERGSPPGQEERREIHAWNPDHFAPGTRRFTSSSQFKTTSARVLAAVLNTRPRGGGRVSGLLSGFRQERRQAVEIDANPVGQDLLVPGATVGQRRVHL